MMLQTDCSLARLVEDQPTPAGLYQPPTDPQPPPPMPLFIEQPRGTLNDSGQW